MTAIVYYDQDLVGDDDFARAHSLSGLKVVDVTTQSAIWVLQANGEPERILGHTSNEFRNVLMTWIDRFFKALKEEGLERAGWNRHGVPLLEVLRYGLLYDASRPLHRLWALSEIIRRWSPAKLIWLSRPEWQFEFKETALLLDCASAAGLDVSYAGKNSLKSFHEEVTDRAKEIAWPQYRYLKSIASRLAARIKIPEPNGTPRVVFTEYFPNSAKASIPVAEMLERERKLEVVWIAARERVKTELTNAGVRSFLIAKIPHAIHTNQARLSKAERQSFFQLLKELPDSVYSFSTGTPSCRPYIVHLLARHLLPLADESAFWVTAYYHSLKSLEPVAVVSTTYSSIPGRAAALAIRRLGGKAVYIQHGAFPDQFVNSFFCHDLMLMWGKHEKKSLLRFGHADDSVQITGATIYDRLANTDTENVRPFPSTGKSLSIGYLASRTGGAVVTTEIARKTLRLLADVVSSFKNATLTVKTHPGDNSDVLDVVMNDYPGFMLERGRTSQEVIAESDLVVVVSSTTGLEACYMGKPLVVFNLTGMKGFVDYVSFGAAIEVTNVEALKTALNSIQQDDRVREFLAEGRKRFLDEMLNGGVGGATRLAAAEIGKLVGAPSR